MKYLFLFLLLCVGLWLWRQRAAGRTAQRHPGKRAAHQNDAPTEMVSCQICAVHLPRQEALPGAAGLYCSDAHRRQAEQRP